MSKDIYFVDQTLRDGQQSLWATRMTTPMMLAIAPVIDEAGYSWVNLTGPASAGAAIQYLRESVFERIRLLVKAMPKTPLSFGVRSRCMASFVPVPDSVTELWINICAANGIRYMGFQNALGDLTDMDKEVRLPGRRG